jgi:hypothetical protein
MGTAAFFPSALYTTNADILNSSLTRGEWQQVAVEIESIEAELGTDPSGTAFLTVASRLNAIMTGQTLSATGHSSILSTAASHPFSAITGTVSTSQINTSLTYGGGWIGGTVTSTAGSIVATALTFTGTATIASGMVLTAFDTSGKVFWATAVGGGGGGGGATSYTALNPRAHAAEHHAGGTDALTLSSIAGSITANQHGSLSTAATHPFSALTGTFTAAQHGNLSGSTAAIHSGSAIVGTLTASAHGTIPTDFTGLHTFSQIDSSITAIQHGSLGTAATHPFSALTGTFTATQHGSLGTAATHPFSAITGTIAASQHGDLSGSTAAVHSGSALVGTITASAHGTIPTAFTGLHTFSQIDSSITAIQHGNLSGSTAAIHSGSAIVGTLTASAHGTIPTSFVGLHTFSQIDSSLTATQHGSLGTAATHPFSALTGTFTATQHGSLGTDATHPFSAITGTLGTAQLATGVTYHFGLIRIDSTAAPAANLVLTAINTSGDAAWKSVTGGGGGATAYTALDPRAHAAEHHAGGTDALTLSSISGSITATQHGSLGTAATHPFSALTGTFTATQHGSLGTAATHPFSAITGTLNTSQLATGVVYHFGLIRIDSTAAPAADLVLTAINTSGDAIWKAPPGAAGGATAYTLLNPRGHAAEHQAGGTDALTLSSISGILSSSQTSTTARYAALSLTFAQSTSTSGLLLYVNTAGELVFIASSGTTTVLARP